VVIFIIKVYVFDEILSTNESYGFSFCTFWAMGGDYKGNLAFSSFFPTPKRLVVAGRPILVVYYRQGVNLCRTLKP
jgi:hypothetical protein